MKARLIWRYTDELGFWGTCPKWARGLKIVKKERVLWVGAVPKCYCYGCSVG